MIVPYSGARHLLDRLLAAPGLWFHLYVNLVALGPNTVLDDLTEASWPDYKPYHVHTWTPALTVGGLATSFADPQTWIRGAGGSASQTVGYYVTYGKLGDLLWVEARAQGPIPMVSPADTTVVYPQLKLVEFL